MYGIWSSNGLVTAILTLIADSMMLVIGLLSSKQAFKGHASSDKLTAEDP